MKLDSVAAAQVATAASLGLVYCTIVFRWAGSPGFYPSDALELGVLLFLAARLVAFFTVPRLRALKPAAVVILFGADIYVVLVSAAAFWVSGDPAYGAFGRGFLLAWLGSAPLIYSLLGSYFVVRSMRGRVRMVALLPAAMTFYGMTTLALEAETQARPGGGLGGLAGVVATALRGGGNLVIGDPVVTVSGGLLFAGLLLWAGAFRTRGGVTESLPRLAFVAVGAVVAVAWGALVVPLGNPWLTLGVPTLAGAASVWVISLVS